LEVGAGIGDLTSFFLDRGCHIVISDVRRANLEVLRSRYPNIKAVYLDLDNPSDTSSTNRLLGSNGFDIVFCYGTLYHLKNPTKAIEFMASCCKKMLLLETCVSFGNEDFINPCTENALDPTASVSGEGCRPTRRWVYDQLKRHFEFVYHEEFPTDWTSPDKKGFTRSVFIASREVIINKLLVEEIPMRQMRH
jgi:SAM-dependent methyltransferase